MRDWHSAHVYISIGLGVVAGLRKERNAVNAQHTWWSPKSVIGRAFPCYIESNCSSGPMPIVHAHAIFGEPSPITR